MRTEKAKAIPNLANDARPVTPIWSHVTTVQKLAREIACSRQYFRSLRAAEMAAWELTGGDYVISGLFTQNLNEPLAA